jgi:hypothetical protein
MIAVSYWVTFFCAFFTTLSWAECSKITVRIASQKYQTAIARADRLKADPTVDISKQVFEDLKKSQDIVLLVTVNNFLKHPLEQGLGHHFGKFGQFVNQTGVPEFVDAGSRY